MIIKHFQLQGNKAEQEDSFFISPDNRLFVVCDGVGGSVNGKRASNTMVKVISEHYLAHETPIVDLGDLCTIIENSLDQFSVIAKCDSESSRMGTTMALLYLQGDRAYVAHIGDSRVVLIKKFSANVWSTKDHSIVQELLDAGILKDEEEMKSHPYRNRITRAISGSKTSINDVVFNEIKGIQKGDVFVICSDGLLENFTNEKLNLSFKEREFDQAINALYLASQSSRDNTTAIVVKAFF